MSFLLSFEVGAEGVGDDNPVACGAGAGAEGVGVSVDRSGGCETIVGVGEAGGESTLGFFLSLLLSDISKRRTPVGSLAPNPPLEILGQRLFSLPTQKEQGICETFCYGLSTLETWELQHPFVDLLGPLGGSLWLSSNVQQAEALGLHEPSFYSAGIDALSCTLPYLGSCKHIFQLTSSQALHRSIAKKRSSNRISGAAMRGIPLAKAEAETGPHILGRQVELGTSTVAYIPEPSPRSIQKTTATLQVRVRIANV